MASKKKKTSGKGSRVQFDDVIDATIKGTSSNKGVVRLGIQIPEKALTFTKMRKYFAAAALTLRIQHDPQSQDDTKGQGTLIDTTEHDLTIDCKTAGFRFGSSAWSATVQIMLKDSPIEELAAMSGASVQLSIKHVGKNAEPTPEPDEETDADESADA